VAWPIALSIEAKIASLLKGRRPCCRRRSVALQCSQGAAELRVFSGVQTFDPALDLLLAAGQVERKPHGPQCEQTSRDRDPHGFGFHAGGLGEAREPSTKLCSRQPLGVGYSFAMNRRHARSENTQRSALKLRGDCGC
jgi:hypothetical protein